MSADRFTAALYRGALADLPHEGAIRGEAGLVGRLDGGEKAPSLHDQPAASALPNGSRGSTRDQA
jgi:hypothetical protein